MIAQAEAYQIPGFPDYWAHADGRIRMEAISILRDRDDGRGYRCVDLIDQQGNRATKKVHRLIYEAFYGPLPDGHHVDHIDHDKTNNRPENLRARPAGENSADCAKTSRQGCRRLTDDQRRMIAQLCLSNHGTKAIADLAGIGETTVRRIKKQADQMIDDEVCRILNLTDQSDEV